MKKNLKKLIIFIIFILLFLVLIVLYYKFNKYDKIQKNDFILGEKNNYTYNIDYETEFNDTIIDNYVSNVEYFVSDDDELIYGKLFINEGKKLYLTVENKENKICILEDKEFKTLYNLGSTDKNGLIVYALTYDGDLYIISLSDTDIKKIYIKQIENIKMIDKFTTAKFKQYAGFPTDETIVLAKDGTMIETHSGIAYNPNVINVMNYYYIFEDNTISDISGKMIVDSNNNKVKVKSIMVPFQENKFFEDEGIVVILTESNNIIYLTYDGKIKSYGKVVHNIDYSNSIITISFVDNSKMSFEGTYDLEIYPIK